MKIVTSTIKGFEGRVTFKDPLFIDDIFAIEDAQDKAAGIEPSLFWMKLNESIGKTDDKGEAVKVTWSSRSDAFYIAAILKCVERFEVNGLEEKPTLETFPMTPRVQAREFVDLLWSELDKIYRGETEVPNAS